jgi:hypothetical protein
VCEKFYREYLCLGTAASLVLSTTGFQNGLIFECESANALFLQRISFECQPFVLTIFTSQNVEYLSSQSSFGLSVSAICPSSPLQLICSMVQYYGWARIGIIYSNDTYGVNSYTSMLALMPRYASAFWDFVFAWKMNAKPRLACAFSIAILYIPHA